MFSIKSFFCRSLGLFLAVAGVAGAQGTFVDPSFVSSTIPNGFVHAACRQADHKIVMVGDFTDLGSAPANRIARLNTDGTVDATFNAGTGPNQSVRMLVVQQDGKILIGGNFTTVAGQNRRGLARLNSDGSLDTSFDAEATASGSEMEAIALQADGKILVGGQFHSFNPSSPKGHIARLNPDGSVDSSFSGFTAINASVFSITVQPDVRILIGGQFTTVNGVARKHLARLNANGSLDASFNAGTGPSSERPKVFLQSDGKLIVRGNYSGVFTGMPTSLYRLTANGSFDSSFNLGTGFGLTAPHVAIGPDDRAILAGGFSHVNGISRPGVARLELDGTVDPLFDPGVLFPQSPGYDAVLVQPDGRVVLARRGVPLVRLMPFMEIPPIGAAPVLSSLSDGNGIRLMWSDSTLEEGYKIERTPVGAEQWTMVKTMTGERTRRFYDGGLVSGAGYHYRIRAFNRFGDGVVSAPFLATVRNGVWPGQVDLSLDPSLAGIISGKVVSVTLPDGKLIVAARHQPDPNVATRAVIVRLNVDGSVDRFFDAMSEYQEVHSLLLQPDGKLLVGGNFKVSNGTIRRTLARFNVDGTEDATFSAVLGSSYGYGSVLSMARQPDGKILIGGYFNQVNQTVCGHYARLNANGSVDTTFNTGTGANAEVRSLVLNADGSVVIGGNFDQVKGTPRARVARLLANGDIDATFNTSVGANGEVKCVAALPDGRVLLAGGFSSWNSIACSRMIRLNADGSLDPTFQFPAGYLDITGLLVQPDGKCLITGGFSQIGDIARRSIARLTAAGAVDPGFDAGGGVYFTSMSFSGIGTIIATGDVTFDNGISQLGLASISIAGGSPPPSKPSGLAISPVNASRLRVTWNDVAGESGYIIERSLSQYTGWVPVGEVAADVTSFTDTGLEPASLYYYRVRAVNLQGPSAPSEGDYGNTLSMPMAPTLMDVRSYGDSRVIVAWKSIGYADSFVIERSPTGTGDWIAVGSATVYMSSFLDSGLQPQTLYFYRVKSLNAGGDSAATPAASAVTAAPGQVPAGELDSRFTTGEGFARVPGDSNGPEIRKMLVQADGKLIVCGRFGSYRGTVRNHIARLHADGTLDSSFAAEAWNSAGIAAAALQADGKIIVGGDFLEPGGLFSVAVRRLMPDGSVDSTFNAAAAISAARQTAFSYGLRSIAAQADGKVIVGGSSLLRMNADGTKDNAFTAAVAGSGFDSWIDDILILPNGQVVLSGGFTTINGVTRPDLARLDSSGGVDMTFDAGFAYTSGSRWSYPTRIGRQPDGKILRLRPGAWGLDVFNRFNTDGSLDPGFVRPALAYDEFFYAFALQNDGRIILTGYFRSIAEVSRQGVARLNVDGTVDLTFDGGLGTGGSVVAIRPDGAILMDRGYIHSDGLSRVAVVRLFGSPFTWDPLQSWKLSFGISPIAAHDGDPDSDGISVLLEYALGGNPLQADHHILPVAAVVPGSLTLSYTSVRQDVAYVVETSTDLVHWTTGTVDQGGTGSSVTASVPRTGAQQKFLRLSVRRP